MIYAISWGLHALACAKSVAQKSIISKPPHCNAYGSITLTQTPAGLSLTYMVRSSHPQYSTTVLCTFLRIDGSAWNHPTSPTPDIRTRSKPEPEHRFSVAPCRQRGQITVTHSSHARQVRIHPCISLLSSHSMYDRPNAIK